MAPERKCSVEGCDRPPRGPELCNKHRNQKHRRENPELHRQYAIRNRQKYRKERAEKQRGYARTGNGKYTLLKQSAKQRGLECAITKEEHGLLLEKPCHYCGGQLPEAGTGLDRIDNSKGYLMDNVVPCCAVCNKTKGPDLSYHEFKLVMLFRQSRLVA